jgi:hypothetical protein
MRTWMRFMPELTGLAGIGEAAFVAAFVGCVMLVD